MKKEITKILKEHRKDVINVIEDKEERLKERLGLYYTLRSLLGAPWTWAWLCGSRGRGKSYAAVEYCLRTRQKYGAENVKIYYLRISDLSTKTLLANHAAKAIEPKLARKYNLSISVKADTIYDHNKPLMEVFALVSAAKKAKGTALFDSDFIDNAPPGVKRKIIIIWDEFQIAEGVEKRTVGNPVEQFRIYIESLLRDQQQTAGNDPAVRIICCANSVSECAGAMAQLCNFIPQKLGRFWLTRKHTVIDNIPNSKAYEEKRKKSIGAAIMDYDNDANYTNELKRDLATLKKKGQKLRSPSALIKFSKKPSDWFILWDSNIIKRYSGQTVGKSKIIAMKRYLDEVFNAEIVKSIIDRYDARAFKYADLVSQAYFAENLKTIKKQ